MNYEKDINQAVISDINYYEYGLQNSVSHTWSI